MIKHALEYAKRGWYVFPCKGKLPLTPNGFKDATTDEQKITKWWTKHPTANIGLATGKLSGVTVADFDLGKDGINEVEDIIDESLIPATPYTKTGGGGYHYFFKYNKAVKTTVALRKGLDVRNDGGYVILPPSNHKSGNKYEWLDEDLVFDECPDWLFKKESKGKKSEPLPETIPDGQRNAVLASLAGSMRNRGASSESIFKALEEENKTRCNPPLVEGELRKIAESVARYEPSELDDGKRWDKTQYGSLRATFNNCLNFFETDEELKEVFKFNSFSRDIDVVRNFLTRSHGDIVPRPLADDDFVRIKKHLRTLKFEPSIQTIFESVKAESLKHSYNPVIDYLTSVKWDGLPRLENWLTTYAGVESTEYTRFIGQMHMVGACARADKPGIKYDHMLILEGDQGVGKSRLIQALGGEWYQEVSLLDRSKDTILVMQGSWIIEVAELECFKKQEAESLKAFITTEVDKIRKPYGKVAEKTPRNSIFWGTINPDAMGYLRDQTGNRRFLPVRTNKINVVGLMKDRNQLFAESWIKYQQGFPIYIKDDVIQRQAQIEQEKRMVKDPWEDVISEWVTTKKKQGELRILSKDIYEQCLDGKVERMNSYIGRRISLIMKTLGAEQVIVRTSGTRGRGFDLSEVNEETLDSPKIDCSDW